MAEQLPYPIQPNTGGPLDPHDIIGRDHVCRRIIEDFQAGDQRLVDPRRLGKTSLLRRLPLAIDDDRVTIVEIDFQGTASSDEFYQRLVDGLARHATFGARFRKAANSFIDKVDLATDLEGVTFKASLQHVPRLELLQRVLLASVQSKMAPDELIVLACDEVPMAIETVAAEQGTDHARALLQTLRALRSKRSQVKWLLTGSIGFHHVVRLIGGTEGDYNDLAAVQMGPLSPDDAAFLAECLVLGVGRTCAVATATTVARLCGGIPFLVHNVAHRLPRNGQAVTVDEATAVFGEFVRDRTAIALTHLVTRLAPYYGDEEAMTSRALDHLAVVNDPVSVIALRKHLGLNGAPGQRLVAVLDMLEDDHYLVTNARGVAWRYDVLREIWIVRRRLP